MFVCQLLFTLEQVHSLLDDTYNKENKKQQHEIVLLALFIKTMHKTLPYTEMFIIQHLYVTR